MQRIKLAGEHCDDAGGDEAAASYVMVAADGLSAKAGVLETARHAERRLRGVAKKHAPQNAHTVD